METDEINLILSNIFKRSLVNFLGVYPSDSIPSQSNINAFVPCCYVANTDPIGRKGTHWVAVYQPNPRSLEFFDSFGAHPNDYGFHFHKFTITHHNTIPVQSLLSDVCGHYCIYYLYHRSIGIPMHSIIAKLKSLPHSKSDTLVASFIQRLRNEMK